MNLEALKKLIESEAGRPLKDFLLGYYMRLNNLEAIKDIDSPIDLAVEVKANKKAVQIIAEMLTQIMSLEQSKKTTEDKLYQL